MKTPTLFTNLKTLGRYLGASEEIASCSILVEKGKIIDLVHQGSDEEKQLLSKESVVSFNGEIALPGLIDPQVHFRTPGQEYKESIESGSKAALAGGFTQVISMPNTNPFFDNAQTVGDYCRQVKKTTPLKVHPTGCLTMGLAGERLADYAALKEAGAIALTDDGRGVQRDEVMRQCFHRAKEIGMMILDHTEDESLSTNGVMHQSAKAKELELAGIDPKAELAHVARGVRLSEEFQTPYHVLHISVAESLKEVLQAKKRGAPVSCEVTPHHLLLSVDDIPVEAGQADANWKMNPPLRSEKDRALLEEAFLSGEIDFFSTDHAPHSQEEKKLPFSKAPFGIVGLETAFGLLYTEYVHSQRLSLGKLVELMSTNAADRFGLAGGRIAKGENADFFLYDPNTPLAIDPKTFHSKGANTPFAGKKVMGRVVATYIAGEKA